MSETPNNLARLFLDRQARSGPDGALLYRQEGLWKAVNYNEWGARAAAIARGLHRAGVRRGDHVVLVSGTTVEALTVTMAVTLMGAVLVPASSALTAGEFEEVLDLLKPGFVFFGDPGMLQRLRRVKGVPADRLAVLCTECIVAAPKAGTRPFLRLRDVADSRTEVLSLDQLVSLGSGRRKGIDLEAVANELDASTPAMVIFTAGTIGEQKGVVLTHGNLVFQARTLSFLLPVGSGDVQLLFLPLSHVLGMISVLTSVAAGTPLALGGGIRSLLEDLRDVRPTFMVGVPRVYEKIVEKLEAGMVEFSTVWWEIYRRGLAAGRRVQEAQSEKRRPDLISQAQLELARRTVFQRCRELFGGRMRFLVSGGAPLTSDVASRILSYGLPVLNGFGLTETAGATHLNRLDSPRIDTVGPALPMVQTRIAPDGEILVKGPGLMAGYAGDEEGTRTAINAQGWLHTGDLGRIESDGSLCITGRRKNLIVTATGKNVVPARVEAELHTIPLVSHGLVVGDGRAYLVALLTISPGRLAEWAQQNAILVDDPAMLRRDMRLYAEMENHIEAVNQRLAPHQRIRKFAILDSDFSVDSGELTSDFKLRRRVVFERYQDVVNTLYEERY